MGLHMNFNIQVSRRAEARGFARARNPYHLAVRNSGRHAYFNFVLLPQNALARTSPAWIFYNLSPAPALPALGKTGESPEKRFSGFSHGARTSANVAGRFFTPGLRSRAAAGFANPAFGQEDFAGRAEDALTERNHDVN